ncbi:MAG TPA: hypothetical protein GX745_08510 [Clostridiales bacterium]|nr:hypothetical protein [Clostridiales bacterium]
MATLTITQITDVSLAPNPVSINTAFTVSVTVTEKVITLQPEITYCGEHYAGETYVQGG